MGQCKSKDRHFRSYANAVSSRGCCCLSATNNKDFESKGNMGQCKSENLDFKKAKEKTWNSVSLRKET
jgi:hypothetical protein